MKKIVLFAKTPVLGEVKTRLENITPLTKQDILVLYTAFLKDTISSALQSDADKICLAYYPEPSLKVMLRIVKDVGGEKSLDSGRISLFPQEGSSFDIRLTRAVDKVKNDNDSVVIIGSDAPTLGSSILNKAFTYLREPGVVLGPSGEGGVYLIGLRTNETVIYDGIFSDGMEIENLVAAAEKKRLPLYVLEEVTDVDVLADFQTLIGNLTALKYSSTFSKDVFYPVYTDRAVRKFGLSTVRSGPGTREKRLVKR